MPENNELTDAAQAIEEQDRAAVTARELAAHQARETRIHGAPVDGASIAQGRTTAGAVAGILRAYADRADSFDAIVVADTIAARHGLVELRLADARATLRQIGELVDVEVAP